MSIDGDLRKLFKRKLPAVDFVAVESSASGRGLPDSNYCVDGREGWLEFKATRGWKVRVSPEQVGWAERRVGRGGTVLLAVRKADRLWLFGADALRRFRSGEDARRVVPLGTWGGGPSRWAWDEILAVLARGGPRPSP